jgi:hypothetical protein
MASELELNLIRSISIPLPPPPQRPAKRTIRSSEDGEGKFRPKAFRPLEGEECKIDYEKNAAFEHGLETQLLSLFGDIEEGLSVTSKRCTTCNKPPGCVQCFKVNNATRGEKCMGCLEKDDEPCDYCHGEDYGFACDGVRTVFHSKEESHLGLFVLPYAGLCGAPIYSHCSSCHASLCDKCHKLVIDFLVEGCKKMDDTVVRRDFSYDHWLGPEHLEKLSEVFGCEKFKAEWADVSLNEHYSGLSESKL